MKNLCVSIGAPVLAAAFAISITLVSCGEGEIFDILKDEADNPQELTFSYVPTAGTINAIKCFKPGTSPGAVIEVTDGWTCGEFLALVDPPEPSSDSNEPEPPPPPPPPPSSSSLYQPPAQSSSSLPPVQQSSSSLRSSSSAALSSSSRPSSSSAALSSSSSRPSSSSAALSSSSAAAPPPGTDCTSTSFKASDVPGYSGTCASIGILDCYDPNRNCCQCQNGLSIYQDESTKKLFCQAEWQATQPGKLCGDGQREIPKN